MDRDYLSSPKVVAVLDHEKKRTFVIVKEGLPDVGKMNFFCNFETYLDLVCTSRELLQCSPINN